MIAKDKPLTFNSSLLTKRSAMLIQAYKQNPHAAH
jgi:hypothetical protein